MTSTISSDGGYRPPPYKTWEEAIAWNRKRAKEEREFAKKLREEQKHKKLSDPKEQKDWERLPGQAEEDADSLDAQADRMESGKAPEATGSGPPPSGGGSGAAPEAGPGPFPEASGSGPPPGGGSGSSSPSGSGSSSGSSSSGGSSSGGTGSGH